MRKRITAYDMGHVGIASHMERRESRPRISAQSIVFVVIVVLIGLCVIALAGVGVR
jgi:hypothetical protein